MGTETESVVYFIQDTKTGLIKIGKTANNIYGRTTAAARVAGAPVKLLATIPGYHTEEQRLHERFKNLRHHNEWFTPGENLIAFIDGIKSGQSFEVGRPREVAEKTGTFLDNILTIGEAASLFPFTAPWIRQLCQKGEIECRKSGDIWLIERDSLEAYLASERKPGPDPRRPPSPD